VAKHIQIIKDLKDRKYLIGYIGRLSEGKGMLNFVKALPLIFKGWADSELLIGGDGPLFDEIKDELKNNGLYTQVKLTGWIPYDEIPDYLNEIELLVFPSYSEGLPNIVSEAMACGAVVVATPAGAIPDVIKDGESGFIMENNSPECIAKNVIRALEYPHLDKIVKNARKLIEKEYIYEVAVERYRKILKDLP
jgi:glycosyltransferase involved in cell wall biosynthesis